MNHVLEYLEATASRLPEHVAYADDTQEITFSGLLFSARALGCRLCRSAQTLRRPVAVLSRRSVSCLVGFYAALYAGGSYAPLDADMSELRLRTILEKLRPAAILCTTRDEKLANALSDGIPVFSIDADCVPADETVLSDLRRRVTDLDPAYIIFTSGSTGMPKGIPVCHRSIIDFTDWYAAFTGVTDKDRIGNQAPFFFDLSVKDIYLTLKTGAATYILPKKCFSFPILLVRALNEHRITTLSWATAAFHMTANTGVFEKYVPQYLRRVLLGGEALQAKQLNLWRRAMPDVRYVNLYGPTETTVDCTYYPIERSFSDDEPIPIGYSCENMDVFLLNERDELCAVGEPGEICARGSGIALGYYAEPEKTAAVFTQNPLNPDWPERIYRTGDIGVKKEDGLLYYLCRKDSQIKHNGYRIELGEIETALSALPGVTAAACLYDETGDRIVAFYSGTLDELPLRSALRERLPKYMLPELVCSTAELPRLPNGKLDRVTLKKEYLPAVMRRNEGPQ